MPGGCKTEQLNLTLHSLSFSNRMLKIHTRPAPYLTFGSLSSLEFQEINFIP